jgi:hypothetical protein
MNCSRCGRQLTEDKHFRQPGGTRCCQPVSFEDMDLGLSFTYQGQIMCDTCLLDVGLSSPKESDSPR